MIFNYDVSDIRTELLNNINSAKNIIGVSQLSQLATGENHFISFTTSLDVGGVTIPTHSKGVLVASSASDATLYAIDVDGNLYVAFRNNGNWMNGKNINALVSGEATARSNADTALQNQITPLTNAFTYATLVTSVSDFSNKSFFFSAGADVTLTPSSQVIPTYAKGIFVTTGNDAVIIGITSSGEEIIAYRNGSNWVYPTNINSVLSTLVTNVGRVNGTNAVSSESQLIGKSQFFDTTANIPLGSTGVTLEAYARGVVLSGGTTGAILAVGYAGKIYSAFFTDGAIVSAQTYYNYRDPAPRKTFTPVMMDCTVTYTLQEGYYRRLSEHELWVSVRCRGQITAIGSPAYARIDISSIPDFSGAAFDGIWAQTSIREASGCCSTTPYNVIASGQSDMKLSFQTEAGAGTSANSWRKTTSGSTFYISVTAIFVK